MEHVATIDQLAPGQMLSVIIDDTPAILVRSGDDIFAVEDQCTHDGQPLIDGKLDGNGIECARHGAKFDIRTGKALCMPATEGIGVFAVEVRGSDIYAGPAGSAGESQSNAAGSSTSTELAIAPDEECCTDGMQSDQKVCEGLTGDESLLEALRQVIDPELMINIVDLGLIYSVDQSDAKVTVDMTLTSPACPAGPQLVQQSKMALERLKSVDEAEIRLVMSPPWTPERMTDDARDQLGIF